MEFLFSELNKWLADAVKGAIDTVLLWIPVITTPPAYWTAPWAARAHDSVSTLSWTILTVYVTFQAYQLYINREAGEAIIGPGVLFRRTVYAAILIPGVSWAVSFTWRLAQYMAEAVVGGGVDYDARAVLSGIAGDFLKDVLNPGALFVTALLLGILIGAFLLLWLQAHIRGLEIAIGFIFGPLLATSAAGNDDFLASGTAAVWWRELLVVTGAQVVQSIILLAIFNYVLGSAVEVSNMFIAIGFAYLGIRTPSMLRHWAYNSGVGRGLGGVASTGAGAVAVRLLSKLPW